MIYRAVHTTVYTYSSSVSTCHNQLRLTPRKTAWQTVHQARVSVDPEPDSIAAFHDFYGNEVHYFSAWRPHDKLTVTAESVVELNPVPPPVPAWTPAWEDVRNEIRACGDRFAIEAFDLTGESPLIGWTPEIAAWVNEIFEPGRPVFEAAVELNSRVHKEFTYVPSSTTIETRVPDVFRMRRGVCQDFAHLMIASLRSIGLGARYVSGYLRSGAYTGAEASHAWVSVFVPSAGWVDLDPTNDVIPSDGHLTLAWGRDYGDVVPVKGITLGGGNHTVEVAVRVQPVGASDL